MKEEQNKDYKNRKPSNKGKKGFTNKKNCDVDYNGKNSPNHNDWKFYAASDEIAKDVASVPFNYLGGTAFKLKYGSSRTGQTSVVYTATQPLPCLMNINYINSIGITDAKTQGVNMAAVQLYTYIRHANSGAKNYEAADVMMYILAMRDIYSEFFQAKKILGCASLFNYYNHNLPDLLINSYNIDAKDLRSNLAQYRGRLNIIAKKINSFAVPKYFKIFDRAAYVNSFIFGDSSSIRGQFYGFNKVGYYVWSGTTSTTGTELQFKIGPTAKSQTISSDSLVPYSQILDVLEEQLDALFLDEDALTMSGDILKAFSEGELYTIAQTDDMYTVGITMDEDILAQIENSHCALPKGTAITSSTLTLNLNVTQENQIIKFIPTIVDTALKNSSAISYVPKNLVLNSHKDQPSYTDVLEWTRLMTISDVVSAENDGTITITSTGLELVLNYDVFVTQNGNSAQSPFKITFGYLATSANAMSIISVLSAFDWHPFFYGDTGGTISVFAFGDYKVATLVDNVTIDKINDAAVYGALYGSMYNNK